MRLTRLLFVFVCLLAFAFPVLAQEATAEPTPVDTVTVPVEVVTNAQTTGSFVTIAAGIILAIVGGGSFALVLTRIDKRTKDEAERQYLSLPPVWQDTVMRLLDAAEAALKLAREITDGQPNADGIVPPYTETSYPAQESGTMYSGTEKRPPPG